MEDNIKTKKRTDRSIANIYFLILSILLIAVAFLPDEIILAMYDDMFISTVVSELIIVVPAILLAGVWLLISGRETRLSDRLMYRSVKPSTILMTILYTFCIIPLITLCNCITMLFVDNTAVEYSVDILNMSIPVAVFTIAILPPLCEEFAFRGLVYGGYRRDCRPFGAIFMSAFLFGLMHGNVNQFAYAFVIGVALAILAEATGSIWPTMLVHFIINARTVLSMYVVEYFNEGFFEEYLSSELDIGISDMWMSIIIYAILSILTVLMAGAIIAWVSKNEGRENPLKMLKANKTYKDSRSTVWTISLVAGVLLSVAIMVLAELYTYTAG